MSKVKELNTINVTPISNNIIITAELLDISNKVILTSKPTFSSVQRVVAIGPQVNDLKIGDWIYIDFNRFVKHVKVKSQIKAGIGGQDMIKEEFIPPEFVAPGDRNAYFKITDREIEGTINDYKSLPKEMKETISVLEYEAIQKKAMDTAEAARRKLVKETDKVAALKKANNKGKKQAYTKIPAIKAGGKFRA